MDHTDTAAPARGAVQLPALLPEQRQVARQRALADAQFLGQRRHAVHGAIGQALGKGVKPGQTGGQRARFHGRHHGAIDSH